MQLQNTSDLEGVPRANDPVAEFMHSLAESGRLQPGAADRAAKLAAETGTRATTVLSGLGLIAERDLAEALAAYLNASLVSFGEFPASPVLDNVLGSDFVRERRIIPLAETGDVIRIAMADPLDEYTVEAVRFAVGKSVVRCVASPSDIDAGFERLYGDGRAKTNQAIEAAAERRGSAEDDLERLKDGASEAPVIRLVNTLIARAVEARASDIHLEPGPNELRIRYRIDGVLQQVESPPAQLASAVLSRIKVMAKLNIAERRLPQDGRIAVAVRGRDVDIRVAISPTMHGERATLRILDRTHLKLDFEALGLDGSVSRPLREILAIPHGILLVTGPTGSGKTTTLYAALGELNKPDTNILTVEDPIEYQIAGINQVQVKPQIGLTFAAALRSFLRQDPDIMMVGEIRDLETAQIAVQAALTGHLILSTVHTNDAASTVTRLLDMGVEDYLITSTLNGVVAQRLIRTLCPNCREPYRPSPELIQKLDLVALTTDEIMLFRPRGCGDCNESGYTGRNAIVEVLAMTDTLRQTVLRNADASQIRSLAESAGMQTLRQHGLAKACAGLTSIEEVLRVTRVV